MHGRPRDIHWTMNGSEFVVQAKYLGTLCSEQVASSVYLCVGISKILSPSDELPGEFPAKGGA